MRSRRHLYLPFGSENSFLREGATIVVESASGNASRGRGTFVPPSLGNLSARGRTTSIARGVSPCTETLVTGKGRFLLLNPPSSSKNSPPDGRCYFCERLLEIVLPNARNRLKTSVGGGHRCLNWRGDTGAKREYCTSLFECGDILVVAGDVRSS